MKKGTIEIKVKENIEKIELVEFNYNKKYLEISLIGDNNYGHIIFYYHEEFGEYEINNYLDENKLINFK